MNKIIDEIMAIVKFSMKDMEKIMYPWVIYETNEIITIYLNPYIYNGIVNVLDVSLCLIKKNDVSAWNSLHFVIQLQFV